MGSKASPGLPCLSGSPARVAGIQCSHYGELSSAGQTLRHWCLV